MSGARNSMIGSAYSVEPRVEHEFVPRFDIGVTSLYVAEDDNAIDDIEFVGRMGDVFVAHPVLPHQIRFRKPVVFRAGEKFVVRATPGCRSIALACIVLPECTCSTVLPWDSSFCPRHG